jgi:hypothetical protein
MNPWENSKRDLNMATAFQGDSPLFWEPQPAAAEKKNPVSCAGWHFVVSKKKRGPQVRQEGHAAIASDGSRLRGMKWHERA